MYQLYQSHRSSPKTGTDASTKGRNGVTRNDSISSSATKKSGKSKIKKLQSPQQQSNGTADGKQQQKKQQQLQQQQPGTKTTAASATSSVSTPRQKSPSSSTSGGGRGPNNGTGRGGRGIDNGRGGGRGSGMGGGGRGRGRGRGGLPGRGLPGTDLAGPPMGVRPNPWMRAPSVSVPSTWTTMSGKFQPKESELGFDASSAVGGRNGAILTPATAVTTKTATGSTSSKSLREPEAQHDIEDPIEREKFHKSLKELGLKAVIVVDDDYSARSEISGISISEASYILDLAQQRECREHNRHEEALEEALELYKTALSEGAEDNEKLFFMLLKEVKNELDDYYKEQDERMDELLEQALEEEVERRARKKEQEKEDEEEARQEQHVLDTGKKELRIDEIIEINAEAQRRWQEWQEADDGGDDYGYDQYCDDYPQDCGGSYRIQNKPEAASVVANKAKTPPKKSGGGGCCGRGVEDSVVISEPPPPSSKQGKKTFVDNTSREDTSIFRRLRKKQAEQKRKEVEITEDDKWWESEPINVNVPEVEDDVPLVTAARSSTASSVGNSASEIRPPKPKRSQSFPRKTDGGASRGEPIVVPDEAKVITEQTALSVGNSASETRPPKPNRSQSFPRNTDGEASRGESIVVPEAANVIIEQTASTDQGEKVRKNGTKKKIKKGKSSKISIHEMAEESEFGFECETEMSSERTNHSRASTTSLSVEGRSQCTDYTSKNDEESGSLKTSKKKKKKKKKEKHQANDETDRPKLKKSTKSMNSSEGDQEKHAESPKPLKKKKSIATLSNGNNHDIDRNNDVPRSLSKTTMQKQSIPDIPGSPKSIKKTKKKNKASSDDSVVKSESKKSQKKKE